MENGRLDGKRILVIFNDGDSVGQRRGIVTHQDKFFLTIDEKDYIPINRVIRLEVLQ